MLINTTQRFWDPFSRLPWTSTWLATYYVCAHTRYWKCSSRSWWQAMVHSLHGPLGCIGNWCRRRPPIGLTIRLVPARTTHRRPEHLGSSASHRRVGYITKLKTPVYYILFFAFPLYFVVVAWLFAASLREPFTFFIRFSLLLVKPLFLFNSCLPYF